MPHGGKHGNFYNFQGLGLPNPVSVGEEELTYAVSPGLPLLDFSAMFKLT